LRVALLAYDLAGRSPTDEQVASSIRWVDSVLRFRQHYPSRGDPGPLTFLEREIRRRCDSVDQDSLDRAAEHLQRYDAARRADQR
jgi:hypothetical protein